MAARTHAPSPVRDALGHAQALHAGRALAHRVTDRRARAPARRRDPLRGRDGAGPAGPLVSHHAARARRVRVRPPRRVGHGWEQRRAHLRADGGPRRRDRRGSRDRRARAAGRTGMRCAARWSRTTARAVSRKARKRPSRVSAGCWPRIFRARAGIATSSRTGRSCSSRRSGERVVDLLDVVVLLELVDDLERLVRRGLG